MANESRYTRVCPNCGNKLGFSSSQSTVHCQCCDSDYSVDELLASTNQNSAMSLTSTFAQENIDSNESGLAYLDSIFGVLDWDDFCTNSPTFCVESVSAVVDKMKVKFANQPTTWLFEFKSISIPVQKRFEFMEKTLSEIGSSDKDLEDAEQLDRFDCYSFCVDLLVKNKEFIRKCLSIDLEMMKKFKVDSASLKSCQADFEDLVAKIEKLKATDSIYDLEIVKKQRQNKEDEILRDYRKDGIAAQDVYESAIKNYLFGNRTEALRQFQSISLYRDSEKYINKLRYVKFAFNYKFVEFCGVNYLFAPSSPDKEELEAQKAEEAKGGKKSVTQTFIAPKNLFEFRPIVDGLKANDPALRKINKLIMVYGDIVYYVDDNNTLVAYDFARKVSTKILDLKGCDIKEGLKTYQNLGKFVFLAPMDKKSASKKGCGMKGKPAPQEDAPAIASYRLAIVNADTCSLSFYGENILCITDRFEDKIFYTQGIFKNDRTLEKKMYYVYDVKENKAICPFNREVFIYNVIDNYIIYGLWQPNGYNIDLYSYNLDTTDVVLLEKNAYDIPTIRRFGKDMPLTYEGYVYYTIGNNKYAPLYRVKPDGSDKKEIMTNVETIHFIRNGYFYITKYFPYFANNDWHYTRTLIKSKVDGTSRCFICDDFKSIVAFKQGYIYYLGDDSDLHIVRSDGERDRVISDHCEKVVLINEQNIFFLYKEKTGKYSNGFSLYSMDLQGRNLHKLAFDVQDIEIYDENNIYYSVKDVLSYKVRRPRNDKVYNEPAVENYNVTMYYALNINDLHLTRIFVEGVPEFDKGHEAKGCKLFNKRVLPTLAEQIEYIYPMPEKTKLSFLQEEENKGAQGAVGSITSNITKNVGCSPKKK